MNLMKFMIILLKNYIIGIKIKLLVHQVSLTISSTVKDQDNFRKRSKWKFKEKFLCISKLDFKIGLKIYQVSILQNQQRVLNIKSIINFKTGTMQPLMNFSKVYKKNLKTLTSFLKSVLQKYMKKRSLRILMKP